MLKDRAKFRVRDPVHSLYLSHCFLLQGNYVNVDMPHLK